LLFIIVQGEVRIWRTVRKSMDFQPDHVLNNDELNEERDTADNSFEQELIRRSVDQFFGEFAMVTESTPRR